MVYYIVLDCVTLFLVIDAFHIVHGMLYGIAVCHNMFSAKFYHVLLCYLQIYYTITHCSRFHCSIVCHSIFITLWYIIMCCCIAVYYFVIKSTILCCFMLQYMTLWYIKLVISQYVTLYSILLIFVFGFFYFSVYQYIVVD